MRVITGTARGRALVTLPGLETRPTADRVKQALFNILQSEVEGRTVLDLFAGSGQLGIEALSRGAVRCVFVDQSAEAVRVIRQNLRQTRLEERAQVLQSPAQEALRRLPGGFDLALLDPPYAAGLLPALLPAVAEHMKPTGVMVCETDRGTELPERVGAFAAVRRQGYGRAQLWFYRAVREETV